MSRLWTGRHNIGDKHQSITKCYIWVDVLSERVEGGLSVAVNGRNTDKTMTKRKRTNNDLYNTTYNINISL